MARSPGQTQGGELRDLQDMNRIYSRATYAKHRSAAKKKQLLNHLREAIAILQETSGSMPEAAAPKASGANGGVKKRERANGAEAS